MMLHRFCLKMPRFVLTLGFGAWIGLAPAPAFAIICSNYVVNGPADQQPPLNEATRWLRGVLQDLKLGKITLAEFSKKGGLSKMSEFLPLLNHEVSFRTVGGDIALGRLFSIEGDRATHLKVVLAPNLGPVGIHLGALSQTKIQALLNATKLGFEEDSDLPDNSASAFDLNQIDINSVHVFHFLGEAEYQALLATLKMAHTQGKVVSFFSHSPPQFILGTIQEIRENTQSVSILDPHGIRHEVSISTIIPPTIRVTPFKPRELNRDETVLFNSLMEARIRKLPVAFKVLRDTPLGYTIYETTIKDTGYFADGEPYVEIITSEGDVKKIRIESIVKNSLVVIPGLNLGPNTHFENIGMTAHIARDIVSEGTDIPGIAEHFNPLLRDTLAAFADPSVISGPKIPAPISNWVTPGSTLSVYFAGYGHRIRLTLKRIQNEDGKRYSWRMSNSTVDWNRDVILRQALTPKEILQLGQNYATELEAANGLRDQMRFIASVLLAHAVKKLGTDKPEMASQLEDLRNLVPSTLDTTEGMQYLMILNDLKFNIISGIYRSPTMEELPLRTRKILAAIRYHLKTKTVSEVPFTPEIKGFKANEYWDTFSTTLLSKGLRFVPSDQSPSKDEWK